MRVIVKNGAKYVVRHRAGKCYAAAFAADRENKFIAHDMAMGEAAFFPFNKRTWRFSWGRGSGRPLHFRR